MANPVRVQVLLEQNVARQFDQYCDENGYKKSTLIARLVKDFLKEQDNPVQEDLNFAEKNVSR